MNASCVGSSSPAEFARIHAIEQFLAHVRATGSYAPTRSFFLKQWQPCRTMTTRLLKCPGCDGDGLAAFNIFSARGKFLTMRIYDWAAQIEFPMHDNDLLLTLAVPEEGEVDFTRIGNWNKLSDPDRLAAFCQKVYAYFEQLIR